MYYDRTMLSTMTEERIKKKAQKDALTKIALLLNEYHSINYKYFPSEDQRESYRSEMREMILETGRKTPRSIRPKVKWWVNNVEAWREDLSRYGFL